MIGGDPAKILWKSANFNGKEWIFRLFYEMGVLWNVEKTERKGFFGGKVIKNWVLKVGFFEDLRCDLNLDCCNLWKGKTNLVVMDLKNGGKSKWIW